MEYYPVQHENTPVHWMVGAWEQYQILGRLACTLAYEH